MLKKGLKEKKKIVKNSSEEEQSDRSEVSTNEFEN